MKRAFILCAGFGTRLKPLTLVTPKPLLIWQGKRLLEHIFDKLIDQLDIDEFIINLHHLPKEFEKAYVSRLYRGKKLIFVYENEVLDTGGGLKNIQSLLQGEDFLDMPLIVHNGDIFSTQSLKEPFDEFCKNENKSEAMLVLRDDKFALKNVCVKDENVCDLRFQRGASFDKKLAYCGICFVRGSFFKYLNSDKKESLVEGFLRAIYDNEKALSFVESNDGVFTDIGTLEVYNTQFEKKD